MSANPAIHETPSVRDRVSAAEWRVRCDLAACYRLIARHGWDDLIYTHISARVPGGDDHYLINPFGLHFHEITASSLVKVDGDCNILLETGWSVNPAAFIIHGAIHRARTDAGCVLHLHTVAGSAVSAQARGLLPITQTALLFQGRTAYHDYEGLALEEDECDRLVADLGEASAMILRNHGTLTVGPTVAKAYVFMNFLEKACQMQIAAQAGGAELVIPSPEVQAKVPAQIQAVFASSDSLEWPGLIRLLEREAPDYKT